MFVGQMVGNPIGEQVAGLKATALPGLPPLILIGWSDPSFDAPLVFQVWVNGVFYSATAGHSMLVTLSALDADERIYIDVFAVTPEHEGEDLVRYLQSPPGERAKLSWSTRATWGKLRWGGAWGTPRDAVRFEVWWDAGTGGAMEMLADAGASPWTSQRLADGVYRFRVDPVDAAGNRLTSTREVTLTIDADPDPPTELDVTAFDPDLEEFTATFTESPSSDVASYHIYSNHGDGAIDYSAPVGTVPAPAEEITWSEPATAGVWRIGLRAEDEAGHVENNATTVDVFELSGDPLALVLPPPAIPIGLEAVAIAGGSIQARVTYSAASEESLADKINIYGDAGSGTIDYETVLAVVDVPEHELGSAITFSLLVSIGPLTDSVTYLLTARAESSDGGLSGPTAEVSVTADATPPPELAWLEGEVV